MGFLLLCVGGGGGGDFRGEDNIVKNAKITPTWKFLRFESYL